MPADCCAYPLLCSNHGYLQPPSAGLPEPDAVHRRGGTVPDPGRAAGDGAPRPVRLAERRPSSAGQPRHGPSPLQPPLLPHRQGHRRSCQCPGLRPALGLRAGLSRVPAVADAAAAPHGHRGLGVPPGGNPLSRRGGAGHPGGVPPPGPL